MLVGVAAGVGVGDGRRVEGRHRVVDRYDGGQRAVVGSVTGVTTAWCAHPASVLRTEPLAEGRLGTRAGMSAAPNAPEHVDERPLALVTGASSGIGREMAQELARRGYDLVVVATGEGLDDAAAELERLGASVQQVRADLATRDGVEEVHRAVEDRAVAVAALNAGVGSGGPFRDTDLDDDLRLIDLNVRSTVHLAKHLVRDMTARGSGRLLFTSSISSTHPDAFEAVYGASKTFVQSFAKALRTELGGTGVTVTSLMPGPTATSFFHRAGMDDTRIGASDSKDDPAEVARLGIEAMLAGKEQVVPGLPNKLITAAARVLPDRVKAALHGALAAPGSGR